VWGESELGYKDKNEEKCCVGDGADLKIWTKKYVLRGGTPHKGTKWGFQLQGAVCIGVTPKLKKMGIIQTMSVGGGGIRRPKKKDV